MKIKRIPPLRCKDCNSTCVIHDYATITCDDCNLIDGKGKRPDSWKVKAVEVKPTRSAYHWEVDEDEDGYDV